MTQNESPDDKENRLPQKITFRINKFKHLWEDAEDIMNNGVDRLQSEHPVAVVEFFLKVHEDDWASDTFSDYSYDLTRLLEYCEFAQIDDLSTFSSRDVEEFKLWRKRDDNINLATLHGQLSNIRSFIRWCESVEIIEEGLADQINLPDLDDEDIVSHELITPEQARGIIEYNDQIEWVTREFAEFAVMWTGLVRLGGLRGCDLEDYNREEQYITLNHRPESDTPLKNGAGRTDRDGGERRVNLPSWVCKVLNTYIDGTGDPHHPRRFEVEDSWGRKPLFTSKVGRVSKSTVRRDLYRVTQPCRYSQECPEGRDPSECRARNDNDKLSKCPENTSPHPVRRGGICYQLQQSVDKDVICGRADVTRKVLDRHYNLRSLEEARRHRRKELRKHLDGYQSRRKIRTRFSSQIPLLNDLTTVIESIMYVVDDKDTQERLWKGTIAYCGFVILLAFNFSLVGIGIQPGTWEIVLP